MPTFPGKTALDYVIPSLTSKARPTRADRFLTSTAIPSLTNTWPVGSHSVPIPIPTTVAHFHAQGRVAKGSLTLGHSQNRWTGKPVSAQVPPQSRSGLGRADRTIADVVADQRRRLATKAMVTYVLAIKKLLE